MLDRHQQGIFRPLVSVAWRRHCQAQGLSLNDVPARDRWYRDQLFSCCGITSTRQAISSDYQALVDRFQMLAGPVPTISVRGLTERQLEQINKLVLSAWEAVQCRGSIDAGLTFNQWAAAEFKLAGHDLDNPVSRVKGFDEIAAHFAVIAGDMYWIDKTSQAAEIRMRHIILGLLRDLDKLTGDVHDWQYCRAIYSHMGLPLTIEEAPAQLLRKILQALDTQVRRTSRKEAESPAEAVPF